MRTAVDTNVLSAIWGSESNARELSSSLAEARRLGSVVLCGAVYAEAIVFPKADEAFVRGFLEQTGVTVDCQFDQAAWAETGRRYALYAERRRRSSKPEGRTEGKRVLADFIVGTHAVLHADRLLTLDWGRYRRDFPELKLI